MNNNLNRFIEAHESDYEQALEEIKKGRKITHWMWYIFPQITGLGMSETAKYYEIKSLDEAVAYLKHEILGRHLLEISNELLSLNTNDPEEIFGYTDALKLRSSMTLFSYISKDETFNKVIEKYYDNNKDENTINICKKLLIKKAQK